MGKWQQRCSGCRACSVRPSRRGGDRVRQHTQARGTRAPERANASAPARRQGKGPAKQLSATERLLRSSPVAERPSAAAAQRRCSSMLWPVCARAMRACVRRGGARIDTAASSSRHAASPSSASAAASIAKLPAGPLFINSRTEACIQRSETARQPQRMKFPRNAMCGRHLRRPRREADPRSPRRLRRLYHRACVVVCADQRDRSAAHSRS